MVREGMIEVCDLCRKTYFRKVKEQNGGLSIYEDSKLDRFEIGAFYYRICSTCSAKILTLAEQIQKDNGYRMIELSISVEDLALGSAEQETMETD